MKFYKEIKNVLRCVRARVLILPWSLRHYHEFCDILCSTMVVFIHNYIRVCCILAAFAKPSAKGKNCSFLFLWELVKVFLVELSDILFSFQKIFRIYFLLEVWAWCHILFSNSDWLPWPSVMSLSEHNIMWGTTK